MARGKTWVRNCGRCGEDYSMPFGSHGDHPGCKVRYVVGLDCSAGDFAERDSDEVPHSDYIVDVSTKRAFYSKSASVRAKAMENLCRERGATCCMLARVENGQMQLFDEYLDEEAILGGGGYYKT